MERLTKYNVLVNDKVTVQLYTDRHVYTVVEVSESGKTLTIKRDQCTAIDKPEFDGMYCTNNHEIRYICKADPCGSICKARLCKDGYFYMLGTNKEQKLYKGAYPFYDYNF